MKQVTLSILILVSVLLTACGQQGGGQSTAPKATFSVWASSSGDIKDLSQMKFGVFDQGVDPAGCSYDLHVTGTENSITYELVNTTADTTLVCNVYGIMTYTNDGTTLTICNADGSDCEIYH